ncbi:MAG: nuclear transport factor 2 family protein [Mongoliitalea sp.]
MEADARENPLKVFKILRVLEDGELVAVHSTIQQKPDADMFVLAHFFRFDGKKIAELWGVEQGVPKEMENEHGMF